MSMFEAFVLVLGSSGKSELTSGCVGCLDCKKSTGTGTISDVLDRLSEGFNSGDVTWSIGGSARQPICPVPALKAKPYKKK